MAGFPPPTACFFCPMAAAPCHCCTTLNMPKLLLTYGVDRRKLDASAAPPSALLLSVHIGKTAEPTLTAAPRPPFTLRYYGFPATEATSCAIRLDGEPPRWPAGLAEQLQALGWVAHLHSHARPGSIGVCVARQLLLSTAGGHSLSAVVH